MRPRYLHREIHPVDAVVHGNLIGVAHCKILKCMPPMMLDEVLKRCHDTQIQR